MKDQEKLLQKKLQVLELKLEERDIELEALRQQANGSGVELNDAREAKMKDLTKRAKAATMALGRERAANAQLKADLIKKTKEAEGGGGGGSGGGGLTAAQRLAAAQNAVGDGREGIDPATRERELKESREQLAAANARLHEARVGVAPGAAFGPAGEGHIRLCFAASEALLHDALDRLEPVLR